MDSIIKKSDILLIILLSVFAFVFVFIFDFSKQKGAKVIIKVNGKVYKILSIQEDTKSDILSEESEVTNSLEIENGKATMYYANCTDKLCLKQGSIQHTNETIVCLPNKVIVEIVNTTDDVLFDAIVK